MSEDQAFYQAADAVSADYCSNCEPAPGKVVRVDKEGMCADCGKSMRYVVVNHLKPDSVTVTIGDRSISADAPKPGSMADRLWEVFRLGEKAGVHYRIRYFVDQQRDEAAELVKELTAMRSPIEVKAQLVMTDRFLQQIGYTQDEAKHWVGYGCALKWMLREE